MKYLLMVLMCMSFSVAHADEFTIPDNPSTVIVSPDEAALGQPTKLFTDGSGSTVGTVQGKPAHIFTDKSGNTTGSVGDHPIKCFSDAVGNTTCNN